MTTIDTIYPEYAPLITRFELPDLGCLICRTYSMAVASMFWTSAPIYKAEFMSQVLFECPDRVIRDLYNINLSNVLSTDRAALHSQDAALLKQKLDARDRNLYISIKHIIHEHYKDL